MRLVKVFESGRGAVLGLPDGFCLGQVALWLFRSQFLHIACFENQVNSQPAQILRVLPLLSTLHYVNFPAILAAKPAVEEAVALLAGNLEADETKAFSRNNGLLTFAADDDRLEFHGSPP
jgi:hypothetical protein